MKNKENSSQKLNIKKMTGAIDKAKGEHPELTEALDLLTKLTEISFDEVSPVAENISWDKLDEGFPVIDKRLLPEDLGPLQKRFNEIVEILATEDKGGASDIITLFGKEELFKKLLEGVLVGQYNFPKEFTHSKPITLFAAGEALLPIIDGIKKSDPPPKNLDLWGESYCPICGALPNISAIEGDENRLFLYCSRCAQTWNFRRLVCTHCGEDDQHKLQYFHAEDNEIHRVYVCDTCKHYLKSVDKREKTTVIARLEDVLTIALDIVAKREGYKRETIDFVGLILMDYKIEK